jgi:hypothetical protein
VPTAFVLVNTEIGSELAVLSELKKVERVKEAVAIYGLTILWCEWRRNRWMRLSRRLCGISEKWNRVRVTLTMIMTRIRVPRRTNYTPYHIRADMSIRQGLSLFCLESLKYP